MIEKKEEREQEKDKESEEDTERGGGKSISEQPLI